MINFSKDVYIKHFLFFFTSIILLYLTCFSLETITDGDGTSYMITSWAISNHQSPDIRPDDVANLSHLFVSGDNNIVGLIAKTISEGKQDRILTFIKDEQGRYYDVHFWFYSAMCAPLTIILKFFHANQFLAFQVTNALIIIFGLFYLLYLSSLPLFQRIIISILHLFSGIFFYLRWPHPEVLMSMAVLLSAVAMVEKQKNLSIFFASIGALQNSVICLFLPVIFLYNISSWLKLDFKHKVFELSKTVACSILSITPFIFYYIKFGKLSLIPVSVSGAGFNISRLFSFFFDLNQGMLVGMPAILIASIFFSFCSLMVLIKQSRPIVSTLLSNTNFEYKNILLVVGSLLMAWGTTILVDLNTGQSVFIRYAVWAGAPLIVYLTINLVKFRYWLIIGLFLISIQILDSYANRKYKTTQDYLNLNQFSRIVLDHFPSIYNPEPEVFIERVLGEEIVKGSVVTIVNKPVVYSDGQGFVRKIAFRKEALPMFHESVCGVNRKLVNTDNIAPDLSKVCEASGGYFYLSGKFICN